MLVNPVLPVDSTHACDTVNMKCTIASHNAAKQDDAAWADMEPIGIQKVCEEYDLDLRNCKCCGSTLTRKVYKTLIRTAS